MPSSRGRAALAALLFVQVLAWGSCAPHEEVVAAQTYAYRSVVAIGQHHGGTSGRVTGENRVIAWNGRVGGFPGFLRLFPIQLIFPQRLSPLPVNPVFHTPATDARCRAGR